MSVIMLTLFKKLNLIVHTYLNRNGRRRRSLPNSSTTVFMNSSFSWLFVSLCTLVIHNPDSQSVIVDLSQVFTRCKVLNNLSSEHVVVGKVSRIRIT